MVNISKNKGTAAETALVKWLSSMGVGEAKRIALAGKDDEGDVSLRMTGGSSPAL